MANFGSGALGALGGAASGAKLGSFFPGIGTGIGAAAGGLIGGLSGLFSGGNNSSRPNSNNMMQQGQSGTAGLPGQFAQLQKFNPQQISAINQLLSMGLGGLQNPYEGFEPIEQQARQNFQTQTVPSIAERFTSLGSGAQRSSAFAGAVGQAGAGLDTGLAALRSQYGMQNRNQLAQLLGLGLTPQFENLHVPERAGFWESAAPGIGNALGVAGSLAGLYAGQKAYNYFYPQNPAAESSGNEL